MKTVKFNDVKVGSEFFVNGRRYRKINTKRRWLFWKSNAVNTTTLEEIFLNPLWTLFLSDFVFGPEYDEYLDLMNETSELEVSEDDAAIELTDQDIEDVTEPEAFVAEEVVEEIQENYIIGVDPAQDSVVESDEPDIECSGDDSCACFDDSGYDAEVDISNTIEVIVSDAVEAAADVEPEYNHKPDPTPAAPLECSTPDETRHSYGYGSSSYDSGSSSDYGGSSDSGGSFD